MDSTHRPTHLADLVEAAAARHADHPALIDAATGATLTWAEFDAAVSAEARRLAAEGVVAGDRVVIRCGGPALAVAVPARCVRARWRCRWRRGRSAAVVAHCAPRVLVADEAASVGRHRSSVRPIWTRARRAARRGRRRARTSRCCCTPPPARAVCLSHRAVLANRAQAAALRPAPVTPVDRVLLPSRSSTPTGWRPVCSRSAGPGRPPCCPLPGGPTATSLADAVERHRVSALAGVPVDVPRAARAPGGARCGPRWPGCGCARAAGCRCRGRGRRHSTRRPGTASSRATA